MSTANKTPVTVAATVNAPIEKVWETYTQPAHITQWNAASEDWHSPKAENDLRVGGNFSYRMEAKDGSFGFDFAGTYDEVEQHKKIAYTMGDGRRVSVEFTPNGSNTEVSTVFDAEDQNPVEMQRDGWQAILNNFKNYTEQQ
jgi:uncharacterized protein YndB with AHSA1/START domain